MEGAAQVSEAHQPQQGTAEVTAWFTHVAERHQNVHFVEKGSLLVMFLELALKLSALYRVRESQNMA